jgi:hypothetical protein
VAGRHVTLAITGPKVSPSGGSLGLAAFDPAGNSDGSVLFSTRKVEIDFTPTRGEAGITTVVISPAFGGSSTGSFTLTYRAR